MRTKPHRGFDSLTPEARTAMARKGGLAAHAQGKAHEWTPDEAQVAGIKGGLATSRRKHEREIARRKLVEE